MSYIVFEGHVRPKGKTVSPFLVVSNSLHIHAQANPGGHWLFIQFDASDRLLLF